MISRYSIALDESKIKMALINYINKVNNTEYKVSQINDILCDTYLSDTERKLNFLSVGINYEKKIDMSTMTTMKVKKKDIIEEEKNKLYYYAIKDNNVREALFNFIENVMNEMISAVTPENKETETDTNTSDENKETETSDENKETETSDENKETGTDLTTSNENKETDILQEGGENEDDTTGNNNDRGNTEDAEDNVPDSRDNTSNDISGTTEDTEGVIQITKEPVIYMDVNYIFNGPYVLEAAIVKKTIVPYDEVEEDD